MIILAFILFIIGIILSTQPIFIFHSSKDSTNIIGFLWITFGAFFASIAFTQIKYSKNKLNLSHTTVMIVPQVIVSSLSVVLYIYGWQVLGWNKSIISLGNSMNNFLQLCLGLTYFIWLLTGVIGFQLGNLGRVGMIQNSTILFGYILQVTILNENVNYICVIGIIITLIGCVIVFYEQYDKRNINGYTQNQDNINGHENDLIHNISNQNREGSDFDDVFTSSHANLNDHTETYQAV